MFFVVSVRMRHDVVSDIKLHLNTLKFGIFQKAYIDVSINRYISTTVSYKQQIIFLVSTQTRTHGSVETSAITGKPSQQWKFVFLFYRCSCVIEMCTNEFNVIVLRFMRISISAFSIQTVLCAFRISNAARESY